MREKIIQAVKLFPPGGMGLHGTTYERAGRIREEGLRNMLGNGACFMPLPLQSGLDTGRPQISEIYERTVGAILCAAGFAIRKSFYQSEGRPAIVIFARWEKHGFQFEKGGTGRNGEEYTEKRVAGARNIAYRTWEIGYESSFPREWVAGIVRIDGSELKALYEKVTISFGKHPARGDDLREKRDALVENYLAVKTLTGIYQIVRCGAEGPFVEF